MNSQMPDTPEEQQIEASHLEKMQPVDFNLTYEQYLIIQHYLPKKYALIQHKNIKKGVVVTSAVKLGPQDTQNLSRVSGNVQNTEQIQGRTKRIRIKKVDKYLQQEPQKMRKPISAEMPAQDQFAQCSSILNQLKKHKNAFPFLIPVDPKRDGVLNYFDIIKQPMDLSTVQSNLNNGVYKTAAQFHAHINKIWTNSFNFNEKGSLVHKLTLDMQKYYKSLLSNDGYKKVIKSQKLKVNLKPKLELNQERDQRKKSEFFGLKDYVYDSIND